MVEATAGPMQNSTIITITPDGIIQSADKNCAKLFGYTIDDLVKQPVSIIIPVPYKDRHQDYVERYMSSQAPKVLGKARTVEGQHKDGSIFSIRITISRVGEGADCIFVGMIDKLEDKSATITIKVDGTVVSCNHNIEELFGYKANEVISNNVTMLLPTPSHQTQETHLANYITGGNNGKAGRVRNLPGRHKNGAVFPISLTVEEIKVGTIQLFRARMEKVDEIESLLVLDEAGIVMQCNHIFVLPLLGYTATELVGTHINILVPPGHQGISYISSNSHSNIKQAPPPTTEADSNEPGAKRPRYHESFAENPDLFWQTPGTYSKQLQHKDGSLFQVDIEISTHIHPETSKPTHSVKIKRSDTKESNKESSDYKMIGPYFVSKTVGQGSYGKVKLAYHKDTRERVAIKILQKSKMKEVDLQRAKRETSILQELKHPYIAQLFDIIELEDTLNIVMEFAGRTLLSYVLEKNGLGEDEALRFFIQLISGMEYCHKRSIIHRDIKHQNILLDDKFNMKLIDFGLSNYMEEGKMRSTFCGTPAYAAPEMIIGKKYNGPEVDIWSMGVVLYSMITGVFPFDNVGDIIKGNFQDPPTASKECCDLLRRMLNVDLNTRITVSGVMEHAWVQSGLHPELLNQQPATLIGAPSTGNLQEALAATASSSPVVGGRKRSIEESQRTDVPPTSTEATNGNSNGGEKTEPVKIIECTVVGEQNGEEKALTRRIDGRECIVQHPQLQDTSSSHPPNVLARHGVPKFGDKAPCPWEFQAYIQLVF
ncbi:hypothetical protein PROFUN_15926 [Planoprotostelium fungivorum]|uniref:non-specific serine/threonine protein kinase n=1 Tax=Planoprotostelium fungivorum TaxID=1890364 RepID=A0A2P6MU81_9EUKA|nr:hypothetical protein PROFUN_15926 [Planoprotostelium fungivorum]